MTTSLPLLSLLVWVPIIGGLIVALTGNEQNQNRSRQLALGLSVITLALCWPLYTNFDAGQYQMQFIESHAWIESFGIRYALGIDGFSLPLIILTSFSTLLVIIAGWDSIKNRVAQYMGAFLVMAGLMNGVFAAMDAILFYVFWEGMLIPMFLIIGIWGGVNRVYATIKFFLYTFLGSVFMLVALIYMGLEAESFAIADLQALPIALTAQVLIFVAFLLAFAVKVPMFPVHTWLPDAHVEAPTGGSVILAAIMLKMGGYGFLRFSLPITPDASMMLDELLIALSLIAVVYIGFVALVQSDLKKLIAYSSIAHMGFVTLGFFIVYKIVLSGADLEIAALGVEGAVVQMISHGFVSGALFLGVGVLYDRMHTREISDFGGVVNTMPVFAAFLMLFAMANAGLPGTSGFVGEFMVIMASFSAGFWIAFLATATLILGAAYTLWMYKRVIFGPVANEQVAELSDMTGRETFVMGALAVMVLALGLYPAPLLDVMHASVDHLLVQMTQSKL